MEFANFSNHRYDSNFLDDLSGFVWMINHSQRICSASYFLPYALTSSQIEQIEELLDNAPVAYSLEFLDPVPATYNSLTFVTEIHFTNLEIDE